MGTVEKRKMIALQKSLSIEKQCTALHVPRSSYYYTQRGLSSWNNELMQRIDEIYTESPDYGSRMITDVLRRMYPHRPINRKRIQRLMRIMGIQGLAPKANLSKRDTGRNHTVYPYLLRGYTVTQPNEVWCSDITYIRLDRGFVYLTAVMDWYTRKILTWEVSSTLDNEFCIATVQRAIRIYGRPKIFNTDQGSQYTSHEFQKMLQTEGPIKMSMDGKGRATDNIMIERFWRTLKYGEIYLKNYKNPREASREIGKFITKYNERRPHSSLEKQTPNEVFYSHNYKVLYTMDQTKLCS